MPNHIKNKILLNGYHENIKSVKNHMVGFPWKGKTEEEKKSMFDFNKITEMPSELNITSDGWISLLENQFAWNSPLKSELDRQRCFKNFRYDESTEKQIDNFAQGIKNYLKYGHASWYGWAVENWGTKWNAYCVDREWTENSITFETAWSNVGNLIKKLSSMFPDVEFFYSYSDEDSGCNCGKAIFKNGRGEIEKLENESKEAWDLYFELRSEDKDLFELKDGTYVYKDDEDVE